MRTVQVSEGPAQLWTASVGGGYAFYTEGGKLWSFDVDSETREEVAGSKGGVQSVVGVNETGEEGAYAYFISQEALGNEENAEKQKAVVGDDNLYISEPDPEHAGRHVTRFIGALTGLPNAQVSPDGRALVFMSAVNLTGHSYPGEGSEEVYAYQAEGSRLFCVSCRPQASGGRLPPSGRWISEDDGRVFFESEAPLVAQDVNDVTDVYEWERDGTSDCHEIEGCDYLISDGLEATAFFADASANGNDVFIATRQRLLPEDQNEIVDLYDARVDGLLPVAPPVCSGTGCQGVPAPVPIFATPSSLTFNGVGNFSPPSSPTGVSKRKSLTRAQKLSRALAECHRKRGNKQRLRCESHAQKLYGAKAKKKSATKRLGK